jgi:hypothetical protein
VVEAHATPGAKVVVDVCDLTLILADG